MAITTNWGTNEDGLSLTQASSQLTTPVAYDIVNYLNLGNTISTIKNETLPIEQRQEATRSLWDTTNKLFIDSDTIRGNMFGLDENVRFLGVQGLEDETKGMPLTKAVLSNTKKQVGRAATEAAKASFVESLMNADQTALYLDANTDRYGRELGAITNKIGNDYFLPIEDTLYRSGLAVPYTGTNEQKAEAIQRDTAIIAGAYRDYLDTGNNFDKERFEQLLSKTKNVSKTDVDSWSGSGKLTSPADIGHLLKQGTFNVISMFAGALDTGAKMLNEKLPKELQSDDISFFEGISKASEIMANHYGKMADLEGVMNDKYVDRQGVSSFRAMLRDPSGSKFISLVQEGMSGLVQGLPEIAVSTDAGIAGLTAFVVSKATDMAKEKGKTEEPTYMDILKNIPYALAYTALNKVEGSVIYGKLSKYMPKGMPSAAKPVGTIALGSAAEGIAETGQTYTEVMKPGKLIPNREEGLQIAEGGVLGTVGGGGVTTIQQAPRLASETLVAASNTMGRISKAMANMINPAVLKKRIDHNLDKDIVDIKSDEAGFTYADDNVFIGEDEEIDVLEVNSGESYRKFLEGQIARKEEVLNREGIADNTKSNLTKEIEELRKEQTKNNQNLQNSRKITQ